MASDVTEQIKLKTGESVTIKLKGLATAGYVWNYTNIDNTDCVKVSKEFGEPEESTQKNIGASVDEVFTIMAQKRGTAHINFFQQRSWEKNVEPVNEKKVTITVE